MQQIEFKAKISKTGTIKIPAELLERASIETESPVLVFLDLGNIVIQKSYDDVCIDD